jgi:NADPH2:quinone reductase
MRFRPEALRDSLAELVGWHAADGLKPHIGARLPLSRAPEALGLLRDRTVTGKIVVEP